MTDVTEAELNEIVGKTVAEQLKPMTETMKALVDSVTEIKKSQPTLIGKAMGGPPDLSNPGSGEDEPPAAPARKRIEPDPKRPYSLIKAVNAMLSHDYSDAGYEREVSQEVQKTMSWASGSGGGLWVPEEFLGDQFIEQLRANQVCRAAGCTVLQATQSPVLIPGQSAGGTAYYPGQNADITLSDVTPSQLSLTPHVVAARTQLSKMLLMTSSNIAETYVRKDIAQTLGLAIDLAIIRGTGTNNQPTGMAVTASINTHEVATNGGALDLDDLYDMQYQLDLDNVPGNRAWICHPRSVNTLRKLKIASEANHYALTPDPTMATAGTVLGYPIFTTTQIPINLTKASGSALSELYLVYMEDIILCEWGTLRIEASDQVAWEQEAVQVKGVYYFDVGVRHANSVCLCNDCS